MHSEVVNHRYHVITYKHTHTGMVEGGNAGVLLVRAGTRSSNSARQLQQIPQQCLQVRGL